MPEQVNTRNLIVDILLAVDRDGEFSHIAIRDVLDKYRYLPHQDRAFIKRVSEGTLERRIEMDYVIGQYSRTPMNKMKPVIREILRSGVYQILYMDSVPDSAACNEAVKLAAKRGFSGLKGFVNGVLRNIARNADHISYPSREKEPVRSLSVRYSMPEWLTERFIRRFGEERCEQILKSFFEKQSTCVRVDTTRVSPEEVKESLEKQGIRVKASELLPYAFYIDGYEVLDEISEFEQGLLYAQNVSSMMVAHLAAPRQGDFILDVCAAPGGKSIHLAQLLKGTGMVEARDLTEYKVELIEENIGRCGVKNMQTRQWDALNYDASMEQKADIVIADLPCSGLGVIGTKTDIKYNVTEEKIKDLQTLQRQILDTVHRYVKQQGMLMYSTCTITPEENQENTEWFLQNYPEFVLEEEREFLPDEGCDGFYIVRLCRKMK